MSTSLRRLLKQETRTLADDNIHLEQLAHITSDRRNEGFLKPGFRLDDYLFQTNHFYLAALQFLDMKKDFVDTFKRYKPHQVTRDLGQFLTGLVNLGKAACLLLAAAGFLLTSLFIFFVAPQEFFDILPFSLSLLSHSLAKAVRGTTQILTAPLTLARMIFRGLATLILGWKPVHEGDGVKELVHQGHLLNRSILLNEPKAKDEMIIVVENLYKKMQRRGENTSGYIAVTEARNNFYSTLFSEQRDPTIVMGPNTRARANAYLQLFKPPQSEKVNLTQTLTLPALSNNK